jgi:hypothetical protein
MVTLCGCIAMMASVADEFGVKQDVDVSYSQAVDVIKGSMAEQGITFEQAVFEKEIARIVGIYDGKMSVHIFITKLNASQCSITVRVGTNETEKKIAEKILQGIIDYSKR